MATTGIFTGGLSDNPEDAALGDTQHAANGSKAERNGRKAGLALRRAGKFMGSLASGHSPEEQAYWEAKDAEKAARKAEGKAALLGNYTKPLSESEWAYLKGVLEHWVDGATHYKLKPDAEHPGRLNAIKHHWRMESFKPRFKPEAVGYVDISPQGIQVNFEAKDTLLKRFVDDTLKRSEMYKEAERKAADEAKLAEEHGAELAIRRNEEASRKAFEASLRHSAREMKSEYARQDKLLQQERTLMAEANHWADISDDAGRDLVTARTKKQHWEKEEDERLAGKQVAFRAAGERQNAALADMGSALADLADKLELTTQTLRKPAIRYPVAAGVMLGLTMGALPPLRRELQLTAQQLAHTRSAPPSAPIAMLDAVYIGKPAAADTAEILSPVVESLEQRPALPHTETVVTVKAHPERISLSEPLPLESQVNAVAPSASTHVKAGIGEHFLTPAFVMSGEGLQLPLAELPQVTVSQAALSSEAPAMADKTANILELPQKEKLPGQNVSFPPIDQPAGVPFNDSLPPFTMPSPLLADDAVQSVKPPAARPAASESAQSDDAASQSKQDGADIKQVKPLEEEPAATSDKKEADSQEKPVAENRTVSEPQAKRVSSRSAAGVAALLAAGAGAASYAAQSAASRSSAQLEHGQKKSGVSFAKVALVSGVTLSAGLVLFHQPTRDFVARNSARAMQSLFGSGANLA